MSEDRVVEAKERSSRSLSPSLSEKILNVPLEMVPLLCNFLCRWTGLSLVVVVLEVVRLNSGSSNNVPELPPTFGVGEVSRNLLEKTEFVFDFSFRTDLVVFSRRPPCLTGLVVFSRAIFVAAGVYRYGLGNA